MITAITTSKRVKHPLYYPHCRACQRAFGDEVKRSSHSPNFCEQCRKNRRGRPPSIRPSRLGNGPGLEAWTVGKNENWEFARQKYIRAVFAQQDIAAGRSIKVIPIATLRNGHLEFVDLACPLDALAQEIENSVVVHFQFLHITKERDRED